MDNHNPDLNRPSESPTPPQSPSCIPSSDQCPAAGQRTSNSPASLWGSTMSRLGLDVHPMAYDWSEVPAPSQLELGSRKLCAEFGSKALELDQIYAASPSSLGGQQLFGDDAARKKDQISTETQSRQSWPLLGSYGLQVLADGINLPCQLVKDGHDTGVEDDAVNLIKLDDEREYLVDLMAAPGTLIPAESGKDYKPYNKKICKLPSFQSPDDLEVVQSRPWHFAGEGSSQCSVMETDSYVDRKPSSSEFFPSFPYASYDPGVGSSGVSGGTAQQLNVNVVPQRKNSSEQPVNLFADLNPFATKAFGKAPVEGNSTEIEINEMPRQKNNPVPDQRSLNGVPRKKDYGLKEGLFLRSNQEPNAYYVPSFIGSSTTDKVNPDRISGGLGQELNITGVPQSKNSSENPTNPSADLNPFNIKGFCKAPMEGNSREIKNIKIPRQKNSPLPDRPPVPLMPKNQHPLNEVPRKKDHGFKEGLFSRSNRESNADDVSSSIGSSTTHKVKLNSLCLNAQVRKDPLRTRENLQGGVADSQRGRDRHEVGFLDPKKCTNDRFMDTNFMFRDSESPSSSIDSNTNKVDQVLDDVDVNDEIQWENLVFGERIGLGSYAEVKRADWNGTVVAVKKFFDEDLSGASLNEFRQEERIMRGLRHPNIVLFMGVVAHPPSIIMEFLPRGSLHSNIHRPHCQIDEKTRIEMALDVAKGMNYLHTHVPTIVHRDLKSSNLLVDQNGKVKVCDFGLSRLMSNTSLSSESTAGEPEWMAPEVLRNEPSNEKCDVYSFGVILWELATLRKPWTGMNQVQVADAVRIQNRRLEIPGEVDPLVRKIIWECWPEDPNLRPSFAQLIVSLQSVQRLVISS